MYFLCTQKTFDNTFARSADTIYNTTCSIQKPPGGAALPTIRRMEWSHMSCVGQGHTGK